VEQIQNHKHIISSGSMSLVCGVGVPVLFSTPYPDYPKRFFTCIVFW